MLFSVVTVGSRPGPDRDRAFLIRDDWNDWFKYKTQFFLTVFDSDGRKHDVGAVKIGQVGIAPLVEGGLHQPAIPDEFDELDDRFFSLGMGENYYETLFALGIGARILTGLRDVAADSERFRRFRDEDVMQSSLLRGIDEDRVTGRFARITQGDAKLTPFDFSYSFPTQGGATPLTLTYEVTPESHPPTNIHVIIGRNGVGKTRCLNRMSRALVEDNASVEEVGAFQSKNGRARPFVNLVSVTFSAFDPFGPLKTPHAIGYAYVGLRPTEEADPSSTASSHEPTGASQKAGQRLHPKTPDELAEDFIASMMQCRGLARRKRWREALETLESDPLFEEAGLTELTELDDAACEVRGRNVYRLLSSGHKIVLLTITRLVETVDERTLVLLDEPEAHLHPPLLAAFVRALSDLLIKRNGVAIAATHSPVVLQETPKSCVWILRRSGSEIRADRPECETFGENVGILTTEVFGLEVSRSGFHKLLEDAVAKNRFYEGVLNHFDDKLGAEARAIARALLAAKGQ